MGLGHVGDILVLIALLSCVSELRFNEGSAHDTHQR